MYSIESNRAYGIVDLTLSPSTIVLVRTNEGLYRRLSLVRFPIEQLSKWLFCNFMATNKNLFCVTGRGFNVCHPTMSSLCQLQKPWRNRKPKGVKNDKLCWRRDVLFEIVIYKQETVFLHCLLYDTYIYLLWGSCLGVRKINYTSSFTSRCTA